MGRLNVSPGDRIYVDTAPIIYSVEKADEYWPLLLPLWQLLQDGQIEIVTSELTLLETLIHPLRLGDKVLSEAYEELLTNTEIQLLPISLDIIKRTAEIRSTHNLKTPDAIHYATAILSGCRVMITNDVAFRRLEDINVQILSDMS